MEFEKRKRKDDEETNVKYREEDNGVTTAVPGDEEVDEFFAILKRIHVAIQYFRTRNGGGEITVRPAWSPLFETEDFGHVKKHMECSKEDHIAGLDLNSDPVSDDWDGVSGSA